ncbi:MAG: DUF1127 domain-containing protein [Alphaproteobacteria bacterium]|nr:DUF1127 domain-containing protein [Alphaproteobacteria bacterium]
MTAISAPSGAKRAPTGFLHTIGHAIAEVFHHYRQRQTLHELSALDDHLLEDIGLRRTELSAASMSDEAKIERDLHLPRHLAG